MNEVFFSIDSQREKYRDVMITEATESLSVHYRESFSDQSSAEVGARIIILITQ